jgi:hypothetical protein
VSFQPTLIDPISASADDEAWTRKLLIDLDQIERLLPESLSELHRAVVERAQTAHANALILSGSTVRNARTEISDLDYHLVGPKIDTKDLSAELDLHVLTEERLRAELLSGDDFVQWSLRFGCVVFDDGAVRRAARLVHDEALWPDAARKRAHAVKSLDLGHRFVSSGDQDAALVQVRTALSLAARARLLADGVFPLSRAELPDQLRTLGEMTAARALTETIYGSPSLDELSVAARRGDELVAFADRSSR